MVDVTVPVATTKQQILTRRSISAANTSSGDVITYGAATSLVLVKNNEHGGWQFHMEYRVDSGAWVLLPIRTIATLDIDLATQVLRVRKASPYAPATLVLDLEILTAPSGLSSEPSDTLDVVGLPGANSPIPALDGALLGGLTVTSVAGSPTVTYEAAGPDGIPAIKVVTGVGVIAEISFPALNNTQAGGDAYLLAKGDYGSGISALSYYVSQNVAGYATGWVSLLQPTSSTYTNDSREQGGALCWQYRRASAGHSNFGSPTYPALVADQKLRITPIGGQAATIWIYGFGYASRRKKGRIAVIADDGYASFFRLGWPSFESRSIPVTCAVIGSAVDTGDYASMGQLRALQDAGGAVVDHGPFAGGGIGSLYSAHSGNIGAMVADMEQNRDWRRRNGLNEVRGADSCYVWPQGAFQAVSGDLTLLNAARAKGFTFGRGVTQIAFGTNATARSKYQRLVMPLVGHTWAGTTAAEATNITAISNTIASLSTDRLDGILMLHRVQPSATADGSMSSIGIRVSDLETLAAAIETGVAAGTLEAVSMPKMALGRDGFWQQA